jgi:hypothetical protein
MEGDRYKDVDGKPETGGEFRKMEEPGNLSRF